jgi:hypothetical protein
VENGECSLASLEKKSPSLSRLTLPKFLDLIELRPILRRLHQVLIKLGLSIQNLFLNKSSKENQQFVR